MPEVPDHLKSVVQYIKNTGRVPLSNAMFDEDQAPIGWRLRAQLVQANLATVDRDGIRLVEGV